jgi:protein disulfide-isomerase
MLKRFIWALLAVALSVNAATAPYDESANAQAQIQASLQEAKAANKPVLVVFGANWCGDCKVLDMSFKTGASAPLIQQHFKMVKVNVGKFDRNLDIAEAYGVPLKKGIPAIAVLSPTGKVIYATQSGELADARNMGETAIFDFLARVASTKSVTP